MNTLFLYITTELRYIRFGFTVAILAAILEIMQLLLMIFEYLNYACFNYSYEWTLNLPVPWSRAGIHSIQNFDDHVSRHLEFVPIISNSWPYIRYKCKIWLKKPHGSEVTTFYFFWGGGGVKNNPIIVNNLRVTFLEYDPRMLTQITPEKHHVLRFNIVKYK